jgi:hypothetical protein
MKLLPPSALTRPLVQPPAWAPAPASPTPASTARVGGFRVNGNVVEWKAFEAELNRFIIDQLSLNNQNLTLIEKLLLIMEEQVRPSRPSIPDQIKQELKNFFENNDRFHLVLSPDITHRPFKLYDWNARQHLYYEIAENGETQRPRILNYADALLYCLERARILKDPPKRENYRYPYLSFVTDTNPKKTETNTPTEPSIELLEPRQTPFIGSNTTH